MIARWGVVIAACLGAGACVSAYSPPPEAADSYANFLVGHVANLRDDHEAASERFYSALERSPDDPALQQGAIASSLAAGDIARARDVARMADRGEDAPALAQLVRAADAIAAGRYREADRRLALMSGSVSEELVGRFLEVWAKAGEQRANEAIQLTQVEAPRRYGGLFAYQRAMALDYLGRAEEARAAYAQGDLGGLWMAPAVERHADLLARTGARAEALALLSRADGRAGNPALERAAAQAQAGQAVAQSELTPARGAALGLYGLASIFLQERDSTSGLGALTLALALDPDLDAARLSYAEAQIDLGHPESARAALSQIPQHSPYYETAQVMEAWVLLDAERGDEAVALARASAELSAGPRSQRALADIYRSLERYDQAEPIYSTLIDQAATPDWRLYYARGVARERLRRWDEAEADLRRALEISPDQPEVLNYLGYTWVDRGENFEEAMAMIQRAAEIRPLSGAIVDSLGWAYFRQGDYEQAVPHLERAVELEPADAVLNDHLGDAYWRVGRRIEARFQWRRALSLDPAEDARATIETKLENGLPAQPPTRSATR